MFNIINAFDHDNMKHPFSAVINLTFNFAQS